MIVKCCDEAIGNGTLVRDKLGNGRFCPKCGKDLILKLLWIYDCGYKYIDGKGLKKIRKKIEQKE